MRSLRLRALKFNNLWLQWLLLSVQRKEAVVEYDDEQVTEAKLLEVINATGFKAVDEKSGSQ